MLQFSCETFSTITRVRITTAFQTDDNKTMKGLKEEIEKNFITHSKFLNEFVEDFSIKTNENGEIIISWTFHIEVKNIPQAIPELYCDLSTYYKFIEDTSLYNVIQLIIPNNFQKEAELNLIIT